MAVKVAVLGGGFAGLAAVNALARRRGRSRLSIRLIDRRRHGVFLPLLPDVISRRIEARHLGYSLRAHCRGRGVEFTRADVREIDLAGGRLEAREGTFSADYLILCPGCDTNYFGDAEIPLRTVGLKWIEEAVTIRERALEMIAAARRGEPASFLVVGGGYTGFEAASHLAFLVHRQTRVPYADLERVARITILEKAPRVLANVPDDVRAWAEGAIASFGVSIRTDATVTGFERDGAVLSDGSIVARPLVVWTPGVVPGRAAAALAVERAGGSRLAVDEHLRLGGFERAFAAGDVAAAPGGDGQPLRMGVQFALSGGAHAARNVLRAIDGKPTRAFRVLDPGYLLPLAPGRAAGVVLGMHSCGVMPYGLHLLMSIYRSWGWGNRAGILADLVKGGKR